MVYLMYTWMVEMKADVIALVGTGVRHVVLRRAIRMRGNDYVVKSAVAGRSRGQHLGMLRPRIVTM